MPHQKVEIVKYLQKKGEFVAIPLVAGILYPQFVLSPTMGAVLMSLNTVVVAINAQLLKFQLS